MASQDWLEKDFYAVLGVSKDVSDADLKKTYRKLARQFHPDSNPGDEKAEARFKEISEAYSVLSEPETRREYDQVRAMGLGAPRFTAGGGGQGGGFEDIFGGMFGGAPGGARGGFQSGDLGDLFGGMFGGGGFRGGPSKGRDVVATTSLDFVSAIQGDTVRLQGVGGKPMSVRIPAGVSDGQKIRLKGRGEPSPDGGPPGDLTLTVSVGKHPVFTRDGNNLRVEVPVTFMEAVRGATIEVPTLGGDPVKLKVAPGTPSGRVLRVKGRGVPLKSGAGDLLATVQVVVPSRLTPAAAKAIDDLAAALPDENPRDDLMSKARQS